MYITELLRYLPAIYHEDERLDKFLKAFETVLLGDEEDDESLSNVRKLEGFDPKSENPLERIRGLEKKIASLSHYFDPHRTPERFLPWLTSWTGLILRADLPREKQRDFIASAISLYRMRGTRANMEKLLEIFTSREATVDDLPEKPFQFKVKIRLDNADHITQQRAIAHALIEREKPAHTSFELKIYLPAMKIGDKDRCVVGVSTFLSAPEEEPND
jgi:phage tail-like protein